MSAQFDETAVVEITPNDVWMERVYCYNEWACKCGEKNYMVEIKCWFCERKRET